MTAVTFHPDGPATLDEPLVTPTSPGSALVRLSQVLGALQRDSALSAALPPAIVAQLAPARSALLTAIESDDRAALRSAFETAQQALFELHAAWQETCPETGAAALGFPATRDGAITPVDVSAVLVTHALAGHQMVTSLAFGPAAGATAYWLHEKRIINGDIVWDALLQSGGPLFGRVRLPIGPHTMKLEARNPATSVFSEEFSFVVPDQKARK